MKTLTFRFKTGVMAFEINVAEASNFSIITLRDTETRHEAEIYSFGGLLNAFRFPFGNSVINIVDAFHSPADAGQHITPFFRSAKLSPFACRMNEGRYTFRDKDYRVEKYYSGRHALHGLLYDAVYEIRESRTDQESAAVVLRHHYDGSDNGYPFDYEIEVEWKLAAGNMLRCRTTVSHSNEFAIPYTDGWHPYFSLDTSIDECYLQFDSSTMLAFDEDLIPTGKMVRDDRFRGKAYMNGVFLDNCFLLDQSSLPPRAILSSEKLRLTVLPDASYPYLQLYTPADRRSIAIENLSGAPDSFNNGMGLKWIEPNETASFITHYVPEVIG